MCSRLYDNESHQLIRHISLSDMYLPVLRGNIMSTLIVVLEETETIENVDDESDWREFDVDPSSRLPSIVVGKGHLSTWGKLQL